MSAPAIAHQEPAIAYQDTDDAIDEAIRTLRTLRSMKVDLKSIGGDFYEDIEEIAETFKKGIANRTGTLLHNLRYDKPEKEALKKLIDEFPSSLEYKNEEGQLPVQSAVWGDDSVGYVPLLAEQGVKYNVGGNDTRGGLLVGDPTDSDKLNVLQLLVQVVDDSHPILSDNARLNTMKDLRNMNLLVRDDISDQNLLFQACCSTSKLRFDYLADWSQHGLKTYTYKGLPIFHSIIKNYHITCDDFPTFLAASLQRHPDDAGLLFQKDKHVTTACDYAFDKYGKEETLNILQDLIPPDAPQFPILHHVAKHIPQYMDAFASRYTSSIYTRDMFGYAVPQAGNQGNQASSTHAYRENSSRTIDPDIAGLYPFMVAASGNTSDHLSAVYCLLRREPSLVHSGKRIDNDRNISSKRKRQRDEDVTKQD